MNLKDFKPFQRSRRGASLVEYSMLAGLVAVVSIGAVMSTGEEIESVMCKSTAELGIQTAAAKGSVYVVDPACPAGMVAEGYNPGTPVNDAPEDNFIEMSVPGIIRHEAEDTGPRRMLLGFTETAALNDLFRIRTTSEDFKVCVDFDPAAASFGTVCRSSIDFYAEDALKLGFEYDLDGIFGEEDKTFYIENVTTGGARLFELTIDHPSTEEAPDEGGDAEQFAFPAGTTGAQNLLIGLAAMTEYPSNGTETLRLTVAEAGGRPVIEWNHDPSTPGSLRGTITTNDPGRANPANVENWGVRMTLDSDTSVAIDETYTLTLTKESDDTVFDTIDFRVTRPGQGSF